MTMLTKLTNNQTNDSYEQEADSIAEKITRLYDVKKNFAYQGKLSLQIL
jgi:hypothetical protein